MSIEAAFFLIMTRRSISKLVLTICLFLAAMSSCHAAAVPEAQETDNHNYLRVGGPRELLMGVLPNNTWDVRFVPTVPPFGQKSIENRPKNGRSKTAPMLRKSRMSDVRLWARTTMDIKYLPRAHVLPLVIRGTAAELAWTVQMDQSIRQYASVVIPLGRNALRWRPHTGGSDLVYKTLNIFQSGCNLNRP